MPITATVVNANAISAGESINNLSAVPPSRARTSKRAVRTIIRTHAPHTEVKWDIGHVGTDHSHWPGGQATIQLNPLRLTWKARIAVASVRGACYHEIGHIMNTPADWQPSGMDGRWLEVFRVYEDLYVNAAMRREAPGSWQPVSYAFRWSNPGTLRSMVAQRDPTHFGQAMSALCCLEFLEGRMLGKPNVKTTSHVSARLVNEVSPLTDPLQDAELAWQERVDIYWAIANKVSDILAAEGLDDGRGAPNNDPRVLNDTPGCDACGGGSGKGQPGNPNGYGGNTDKEQAKDALKGAGDAEQDGINDVLNDEAAEDSEGEHDPRQAGPGTFTRNPEVAYSRGAMVLSPVVNEERMQGVKAVFHAKSSNRNRTVHGTDEGRISGRKLHRLIAGKPDFYKGQPVQRNLGADVLILVDGSGSMSGDYQNNTARGGSPITAARNASAEIGQALSGNSDYAVTVWMFTDSYSAGVDITAVQRNSTGKFIFPKLKSGGTPTHSAILFAARWLRKRGATKRVILHITDLEFGKDRTPQFDAEVTGDPALALATIGVGDPAYAQSMAKAYPWLHITAHTTVSGLVGAVAELCAKL